MSSRNRDTILGQARDDIPVVLPHEVLYAGPNRNGERKRCGNCLMFVLNDGGVSKCMIHPRSLEVLDRHWCGYNIEGAPVKEWMDHPGGMIPVDPKESGLRVVGGGISCDTCVFFRPRNERVGLCVAVANPSTGAPPYPVAALGICRRHKPL